MTSTPSSKPCTEIGPLRALLATLVDYAGLFPPAGLNMSAAVAAFDAYRRGEHAWMLGGFVVPAGRLEELAQEIVWRVTRRGTDGQDAPGASFAAWPVSVIVESPEQGARVLADIRGTFGDVLSVAALEVRPVSADVIDSGEGRLLGTREDVAVFYEVPLDDGLEVRLDAVAEVGAGAKVRTGGVTAAAFPQPTDLVRFVRGCAERDLPFKATAGLHHAFAGRYPLTYRPDSVCGPMHGFMALALVAVLIRERDLDEIRAVEMLQGGAERLRVGDGTLTWNGLGLVEEEIARARAEFFRSFGSCSFMEPVSELREAGLI